MLGIVSAAANVAPNLLHRMVVRNKLNIDFIRSTPNLLYYMNLSATRSFAQSKGFPNNKVADVGNLLHSGWTWASKLQL